MPGVSFYRACDFRGYGVAGPAGPGLDAARFVDPAHPILGPRVRRDQAGSRLDVLDHAHPPPIRDRGRALRRVSGGHASGAASAGGERSPDAGHPRLLRIHRLSSLPEPGGDGSERQCGHGRPDHRLGPRVHRDLRDSPPEGADRPMAIRGDCPRFRRPRSHDLLRSAGESIHVPRLRRRLDGPPARNLLRPLRGPRQELPPAVPSLHVRRVDAPHRNGPPGAS